MDAGPHGETQFDSTYYKEIGPVLLELGVPPQTVPVLAKDTSLSTVHITQAVAQREDLESLVRPLLLNIETHFGIMPDTITIYLSELFDHYAWATEKEWTMVINPAYTEDFETQFPVQVAHNLAHCARYNRIRDSFRKETKLDLFKAEHRRQFRLNAPLAEDVINEGIAAVGGRFIVKKYPGIDERASWYAQQNSRLLQEFFGALNVTGQDRLLFMNDRSALPPGQDWHLLPREWVYVGHYLGWFIVNHALTESQLPFRKLLERTVNEILDLGFTHMRHPRKE